LEIGDTAVYIITARNDSAAGVNWYNVVLTDVIDTGSLTFVSGSVTIDGVATTQYTFRNGTLEVEIGTIASGESVVVQFEAIVRTDAHGTTVHNTATFAGSSTPDGDRDIIVRDSTELEVEEEDGLLLTEQRMMLFDGYPDGTWRPVHNPELDEHYGLFTRAEAAHAFFRLVLRPTVPTHVPIPPDAGYGSGAYYARDAIRFFLDSGGMSLDADGNFRGLEPITLAEFRQLVLSVPESARNNFAPPAWVNGTNPIQRHQAAELMANMFAPRRGVNFDTNGLPYPRFTDIPSGSQWYHLVTDVSSAYAWFLGADGRVTWDYILD